MDALAAAAVPAWPRVQTEAGWAATMARPRAAITILGDVGHDERVNLLALPQWPAGLRLAAMPGAATSPMRIAAAS